MASPHLTARAEARLHDRGIRVTRNRLALVEALAGSEGPRSAAELHGQIGDRVPLSSLYRSLSVLEAAGVVVPHLGAKGLTRYELAEWLIGHHHHLVCLECGTVEDVEVPGGVEEMVERIVGQIAAGAGFRPARHVIEIEGRCSACS